MNEMILLSKKNLSGSILLEALLSVVILSVSIVLIVQAITSSFRATVYSTQYVEAINEIDNAMAQAIGASFQGTAIQSDAGVFDDFSGRYEYELSLADALDGGESSLQEVKLAVKWQAGNKKNAIEMPMLILKDAQSSNEGAYDINEPISE
jgi:type II secretory pathway pseudopilin PulG